MRYKNNLPAGFQPTEFKHIHLGPTPSDYNNSNSLSFRNYNAPPSPPKFLLWTSYEDCCPYYIDVDLNSYINPENSNPQYGRPFSIQPNSDVAVPYTILKALGIGFNLNVYLLNKDAEKTYNLSLIHI